MKRVKERSPEFDGFGRQRGHCRFPPMLSPIHPVFLDIRPWENMAASVSHPLLPTGGDRSHGFFDILSGISQLGYLSIIRETGISGVPHWLMDEDEVLALYGKHAKTFLS
jgi:hypothetical protein